ncbi:MAG: phytanoyl-CoA dioxygenase family protein, partial [Actinomycetota bacterium]
MEDPAVADRSPDFETDGFVVLDELLPPDAVAEALAAVERLEDDEDARRRHGAGIHVNHVGLERLVMRRPPAPVRRLADADAVMLTAATLLADRSVVTWGHEVLTKRPATDETCGAIGWHQDRPYFHWWEGPTLTAWIALTDQTGDSAPVTYVPGSHRWGDRLD